MKTEHLEHSKIDFNLLSQVKHNPKSKHVFVFIDAGINHYGTITFTFLCSKCCRRKNVYYHRRQSWLNTGFQGVGEPNDCDKVDRVFPSWFLKLGKEKSFERLAVLDLIPPWVLRLTPRKVMYKILRQTRNRSEPWKKIFGSALITDKIWRELIFPDFWPSILDPKVISEEGDIWKETIS